MHGILKLFRPNAAIDRSEIAQWPTRPKIPLGTFTLICGIESGNDLGAHN